MKHYKTSKDYRGLRKLLDAGKRILFYIPSAFGYPDSAGFATRCTDGDGDYIYNINGDFSTTEISDSEFASWMKELRLEYVKPTK